MDKPMNRIKEVLEEKGIKQTWLAEKLGKSFCIVNSYVCNRRQPSLEVLFEIAQILHIDKVADDIKNKSKTILAVNCKSFIDEDFDNFSAIFDLIDEIRLK